MSVKSRILQFQKNDSTEETNVNNNVNNIFSIVNRRSSSSLSTHPNKLDVVNQNNQPNQTSSTITTFSTVTRELSNGSISSHSTSNNNNNNNTHQHSILNGNSNNRNANTNNTHTPTPTSTSTTAVTTGAVEKNFLSCRQNSMEKPVIASKKTSLSINLNSSNNSNSVSSSMNQMNGMNVLSNNNMNSGNNLTSPKTPTKGFSSQLRPRTPTSKMSTGIPKPTGSVVASSPFHSASNHNSVLSKTTQRKNSTNGVPYSSPTSPVSSSTGVIDWKLKYEESERKRLTVVTLAQKATRDYEELRRRFRASELEREKLAKRLDSSVSQLDLLRKAAENTYEEYHKLKKQYENENRNKSEALSRVDQYNKENRRLKRQSFQLMQKIDPSNYTIEEEKDVVDGVENDQEISFLRNKVQELEGKIVNLETELEKTKLDEFESQEFMLMNDTNSSAATEVQQLNAQIMKLEEENRKLHDSLDDAVLELDNTKAKDIVENEKLQVAEIQLRKIRNEKNILQRQSMVFMSDMGTDNRLMDALSQIGELQTALEDQKNNFQSQIEQLSRCLSEREISEETLKIQNDAKVKALEEEIKTLREKAEEAERKLEEAPVTVNVAPPPPPPPPMMMACPPPPPPPPMMMTSLSASLNKPLKKTPAHSIENLADESSNERPGNAQIDDVVSQIKKGIKLRSTQDRTLSRKQTEAEKPQEAVAVEEMKNILNNLKRTRRFNS